MFVFVCAGCGAELTVPLSRVALPAHAHQKYGNGAQLPVLMEAGTFAEDPEPWGPPWRRWEEVRPDEAVARGVYAPVHALSDGAPGSIVIAPGDARGTVLIPERAGGYCCGLDGGDGPNMACEACDLPVASRIDDCSLWQAVWLAPGAVRRLVVDGADSVPPTWAELVEEGKSIPPFEPIATWGARLGPDRFWSWSPQWEAAVGRALAHLLAASQGRPVTVPDGLGKEVFQRALDALLPAGPPVRRAVLAGPGRPADADADIVLVPVHPRTGRMWLPSGPAASACPVPLPFGVWLWLAFPEPHLPFPATGGMPDGVLRDDPPAPRPRYSFRADPDVFRHTLVRLPAVRDPWLGGILENLTRHMRAGIF
ncbi:MULTISPECIES: hypothetical protein [unclassified Streptomyces]|uniref:hypothetical protein n=1 Tax=unclassified Streptomyces TaxID=2593676 RepID=UPI0006AF65FF|nr:MULTISPECIES: hypothetical protein [unclassified Streptomyces]KOX30471.1 hypothetical protein ADL06_12205 [Streptomyces sp. NRRL F-6491]KOX46073.1 hypothetical protein ADL08_13185 [Streptomyces sp. NRRL F-6492]